MALTFLPHAECRSEGLGLTPWSAADKGYDASRLYALAENMGIAPIIARRNTKRKRLKPPKKRLPRDETIVPRGTPLFRTLYRTRQSVERVFKSMKESRRLNGHHLRGLAKISHHAALSMLAFQVTALRHVRTQDAPTLRWQVQKV